MNRNKALSAVKARIVREVEAAKTPRQFDEVRDLLDVASILADTPVDKTPAERPEHWESNRPNGIPAPEVRLPRGEGRAAVRAWFEENRMGSAKDVQAALPNIARGTVGSCITALRKEGFIESIDKEGGLFIYQVVE